MASMRWIALHLPQLSLKTFVANLSHTQPIVLTDQHRIVDASSAASEVGSKPSTERATALALMPGLTPGLASSERDAQALMALHQCLQAAIALLGEELLIALDHALGRWPDPHEPITLVPAFESRLELLAGVDTGEQLLRSHSPADACTCLEIALAQPLRDSAHLLVLLRERLALLQLLAPTSELSLQADDIVWCEASNEELFPLASSEREDLICLIERLQPRLGPEQVQRLSMLGDHRPEHASVCHAAQVCWQPTPYRKNKSAALSLVSAFKNESSHEPFHESIHEPLSPSIRPIWLFASPQALIESECGPMLEGQLLQLLSGPERIEAVWWDAALAERDYYIAQQSDGALVWIYCTRLTTPTRWFLHGRFA